MYDFIITNCHDALMNRPQVPLTISVVRTVFRLVFLQLHISQEEH